MNGALFESGMKILEKKIPPSPFLAAKLRGRYCGACARQRFKQVKKRSGRKRREKRRKKKKEKKEKKRKENVSMEHPKDSTSFQFKDLLVKKGECRGDLYKLKTEFFSGTEDGPFRQNLN